jgi:hypothetical protein
MRDPERVTQRRSHHVFDRCPTAPPLPPPPPPSHPNPSNLTGAAPHRQTLTLTSTLGTAATVGANPLPLPLSAPPWLRHRSCVPPSRTRTRTPAPGQTTRKKQTRLNGLDRRARGRAVAPCAMARPVDR